MEKKKSKISKILIFVLILIVIGLCCLSYYFYDKMITNENLFQRSMSLLTEMATEGRYPNAFYATIEEISDIDTVPGLKLIKVKALDINSSMYQGEFDIQISLDNIGENIKIKHNGEDVSFDSLKPGQTIAVYDYSNNSSIQNTTLISVFKIDILNKNL